MFPRTRAASHADDDRSVAVKQPEDAVWPGVVKMLVQAACPGNLPLHLVHQPERGQPLGLGQLPEINAQVVMGWGRVGIARQRGPARCNALFRQGSAFSLVGGEPDQVKTGAAELPGGCRLAWCLPVTRLRFPETSLRIGGELRFVGGGTRQTRIYPREETQATCEPDRCPGKWSCERHESVRSE